MSEYDLVCDACGASLEPHEGVVAWREDAQVKREGAFALTHERCVAVDANARCDARRLTWPNGYLEFFGERFARSTDGWSVDASGLQGLLYAFAPFVMRPDNASEMDQIRAASFGERPGVKPGTSGVAPAPAKEQEGGK